MFSPPQLNCFGLYKQFVNVTKENCYDTLTLKQIGSLLNLSAKIQSRSTSEYSSAASLTRDERVKDLAGRNTLDSCREMNLS